jgi:predicted O-methyltransferase YrrM
LGTPAEEYLLRLTGPWSDIQDCLGFLHKTVLEYSAPQVVELGTRGGNSTSALLSAAIKAGGRMTSCDIEPRGRGGDWDFPEEWLSVPEWTFIVGDSISDAVLAQMPAQIDVLFADTDHTYSQTLAELEAYVPRVRPGGVVLQHDTQAIYTPGAAREWTATPDVAGEVARAMDDYCEKHGLSWANRKSEAGYYGLGYIRIPAPGKGRTPRTRPKR